MTVRSSTSRFGAHTRKFSLSFGFKVKTAEIPNLPFGV